MTVMMYIARIAGKWYAFEKRGYQVFSIGRDNPKSGRWMANFNEEGIKYVSSPSPTRNAAYQRARRAAEVAWDDIEYDGWYDFD